MELFIATGITKKENIKIVSFLLRGRSGNIYFQKFSLCDEEDYKKVCDTMFLEVLKYVKEILIDKQKFSIKHISVVGDISSLPFSDYYWKRSCGCFQDLKGYLKKGTKIHSFCGEIYEYKKKKMKKLDINFKGWRYYNNGIMWHSHKAIRQKLLKLAGEDLYIDEDKLLNEFLKYN